MPAATGSPRTPLGPEIMPLQRWRTHIAWTKNLQTIDFLKCFGPSGVRALPVAAGTNKCGHYFSLLVVVLTTVTKPPEWVVVGY